MNLLQYLNSEYSRTRWPYFSSVKLINQFGEDGRKELNELRSQKVISKIAGPNHPLVRLLVTEDGEIITT